MSRQLLGNSPRLPAKCPLSRVFYSPVVSGSRVIGQRETPIVPFLSLVKGHSLLHSHPDFLNFAKVFHRVPLED
jgi:hypothetical protein